MIKSKLFTLLKTFTKAEVKRFRNYVNSPFYNTNPTVIALFELIYDVYPNLAAKKLERPLVLKKLFPTTTTKSEPYLNQLMMQLSELALDFMVLLKQEENRDYQQLLRLKALRQRGLATFFVQEAKKREKAWQKNMSMNVNDYYNQFIFIDEKQSFSRYQNNRKENISISTTSQQLTIFYVIRQLQYYVEWLNRQQIVNDQQQQFAIKELLILAEQPYLQNVPLIKLYLLQIGLLKEKNNPSHFQQLQQFLIQYQTQLYQSDLTYAYTLLLNYCSTAYKQTGRTSFLHQMFELYKSMLTANLFLTRSHFPPHQFKNIATVALRTQQFDWALQFTHTYKKQLAKEYQKGLTHYNLGAIAFYQEDYNTALQHFLQIDYPDFFYHLNAEMLLIKTYYALAEIEALNSKLDALRTYIKRNKRMTASDKEGYRHFVNFMKRLVRLKAQAKRTHLVKNLENKVLKAIQKLQQDLKQCQPLIDKKWLLQQVLELGVRS